MFVKVQILICSIFLSQLKNSQSQEQPVSEEQIQRQLVTNEGYYLDNVNGATAFGNRIDTFECPSDNVITTKYKCKINEQWVDCTRQHCCKDYIFLAGRCISKRQDPCSLNLCEQQCTIYMQRIICTCYDGYKFNPENQKQGIKPVCIDVNECLENNGDCEQECINTIGSYKCACRSGFFLTENNQTCLPEQQISETLDQAGYTNSRCFASCNTVTRLHDKFKSLQEKVFALSTAVRLSSFASGPPGPPGPVGPPGPFGPRGFPGSDGASLLTLTNTNPDLMYSVVDTFVSLEDDNKAQCQCKRGAQGELGAPGQRGQKGEMGHRGAQGPKGDQVSLDFILLILAELQYDITLLQNKIFDKGNRPPKFSKKLILQEQNKNKNFRRQQKLFHSYLEMQENVAVRSTESFPHHPNVSAYLSTTENSQTLPEYEEGSENEMSDNDYY